MLAKLAEILKQSGYELEDSLPVSDYPYTYIFKDSNSDGTADDEMAEWFEGKKRLELGMSAEEVIDV